MERTKSACPLKSSPQEPDYRQGRSHADFIGSLTEWVPDLDVAALYLALQARLTLELTMISR